MIELYNLNISDETINQMLEMEPELKDINSEEIKEKELILDELGCDKKQINNIISSNPTYLTRTNEEILNLIKKLKEYNFTTLDILFDSNPYILNLDPFEIEDYIKEREKNGEALLDIINDLESNPHLFLEI